MQKLECGICRTPFKKEYFENDPIINELFINYNRNQLRLMENNNRQIIINRNQNLNIVIGDRIINSHNYRSTNRNSLRNIQPYINTENEVFFGLFVLLFIPNKSYCIISFFFNILFCGLGTILIGLNKKSVFYTIFGIIQCFGFFSFIYQIYDKNSGMGKPKIKFFNIYFIILSIAFYISSIYIGIFRNFLFFNIRKINYDEKKERAFIIFFLNILIWGLGTLFCGIIKITEQDKICHKIKNIIFGIIQLAGYILTLFAISLINKKSSISIYFIFLFGVFSFFFSLYTSYKYYKNTIVENN